MKYYKLIKLLLLVVIFSFLVFNQITLKSLHKKLDKTNIKIDTIVDYTKDPEFDTSQFPPAPDFSLKNELGNDVTLKNFTKENIKLFIFTDKDCEACKGIYPVIEDIKISNTDTEIIVFQLNAKPNDLKNLLKSGNYSFKTLAASMNTFQKYMIQSTPSAYFINKENKIVSILDGFEKKENLQEMLDRIKQREISTN